MDSQKVDMYILTTGKYFESQHIGQVRDRLLALDDSKWAINSDLAAKRPSNRLNYFHLPWNVWALTDFLLAIREWA